MGMNHNESHEEDLLRRALREEADRVLPSPDALARIRRRTARAPFWRTPLALGMAAAVVTGTAVIAGGVVVLGGSDVDSTVTGPSETTLDTTASPTQPPETPTSDPSPTTPPPTAESTPPPTDVVATVPVYYVTETPAGMRLAREFRSVPAPDGPVVAAVETMLAEAPLDPDYRRLWDASTDVESVEADDGIIEIDLSGSTDHTDAADDVARLAIQELVYTVTAALSSIGENGGLPVQLLVDGEPIDKIWGNLDVSDPVERAPQLEVRQHVQINNPAEGAIVGRTVTVDGEAAVYEATVLWQILDDAGNEVQSDSTTAKTCCQFSPFRFSVELEPGSYEVVVSEEDASGGEGRPPMSDSRAFTVD
jgi:Immunoglobulin-like domain of bacterial spore germination/Sporulation and spore germination